MDGTDRVVDFIRNIRLTDIPDPAVHQGKRCFLDALGALLAGTETPVAGIMADLARKQFAGDECTVIRGGGKASSVGATLANGYAANALDLDDGFRLVKGHPGACILPVLISAGELADAAVRDGGFLTALIVGYEIAIRSGLIRHALAGDTVHASGSWGAVGGAAVAGRLLGLGHRELREALGVAEHHAPVSHVMKALEKPCNGKDSVGWGAMVAMASALMAREGFTGIDPYFNQSPVASWIDRLGTEYYFLNLYFKPFAACRWAQPAIMGALKVFREHNLSIDAIASIRVKTFKAAAALSRMHPTDTEEAQYNMAYPVAVALVDGEVGPRQVRAPRIFDPAVLALADKITVEVEETFEKAFPQKTFADVAVVTQDGEELESGKMEPRWEPPHYPTDEEIESKFLYLVTPLLGERKARHLAEIAWDLHRLESVRQILDACSGV